VTVEPQSSIYVFMPRLRLTLCILLGHALAGLAAAQEYPHWEIFLGYAHQQTDVTGTRLQLHGGHFSVTENVNSWFGGVLDASGQVQDQHGTLLDTETITYGPQFTLRKFGRLIPSVHITLGIVRTSEGFLGVPNERVDFATAAGGALDLGLSRRIALRIVQADWIGTRFQDPSIRSNVRVSAGIQFRFFGDDGRY
jgi:hypothetical protein